jgi:flavin-dependent dehydrogenase
VADESGGGSGETDIGELHIGPDRYCGVASLPGGLTNVTVALGRSGLRAWRGELDARYWTALASFPSLAGRVARARRATRFVTSGPLAYCRRRAVTGRVLLTGDAAAYIDPFTGQGVYLALRGAELATVAVIQALTHTEEAGQAFRAYDRGRRQEFGPVFVVSRLLQALAFRPTVIRRVIRRLAAQPDLGARLIGVTGNEESPASVLRPGFLTRLLGIAP